MTIKMITDDGDDITRVEHLGGKGLVQLGLSVIIAVKRPKTSPNELIIYI